MKGECIMTADVDSSLLPQDIVVRDWNIQPKVSLFGIMIIFCVFECIKEELISYAQKMINSHQENKSPFVRVSPSLPVGENAD